MLEIEKLRKADVFSGAAVILLGLFVIYQALQMPMKDSYGGVQNVWYVSPALFPLLVGTMLVLLGTLLMRTALRRIGVAGVTAVLHYLCGPQLRRYLQEAEVVRFYGIVINLLVLVFLLVPRVDFFLAAIWFLLVFFFMFYCAASRGVLVLTYQVVGAAVVVFVLQIDAIHSRLLETISFPLDWVMTLLIALLIGTSTRRVWGSVELMKKLKLAIVLGFSAPLLIGIIFKFFLLVPMPFEGLIVTLLDAIWYGEFWS